MSTATVADTLAGAILEATGGRAIVRSMFGTVTDGAPDAIRVRPDSTETGDFLAGPLVCGKATVGARVLCLFVPGSGGWVVIGR